MPGQDDLYERTSRLVKAVHKRTAKCSENKNSVDRRWGGGEKEGAA